MELPSVAETRDLGCRRQRSTKYGPQSNHSETAKCAIILSCDEGVAMDIPRRPYLRFNELGGTSIRFTGVPDPPCDVPDVEEKVEEATEEIRRLEKRLHKKTDDTGSA